MQKINSVILATSAIAGSEIANQVPIDEVLKIVVQIVIGIATLIKLFRKPNK